MSFLTKISQIAFFKNPKFPKLKEFLILMKKLETIT